MFRWLAMRRVTSWFPIHTRPASGSWNPAIILSVVVMPHPEGPRSVSSSPGRTIRLTPWSKRLETPSSLIATGVKSSTEDARDPEAAAGLEPPERPGDAGHHREDDGDHEDGEGRRGAERQLRHVLEDAHRDERPVDGHEKDGRADRGHGADEDDAEPREEGRHDERQGDAPEGHAAARPQPLRGLFDAGIDLLEERHRRADPRRAVAEDVAGDDDERRARERQRRGGGGGEG